MAQHAGHLSAEMHRLQGSTGRQYQLHLPLSHHAFSTPQQPRHHFHSSVPERRQQSVPWRQRHRAAAAGVSAQTMRDAFKPPDNRDWDEPAEGFNSIPEALQDLAEGKFVLVLDAEDRENEGDLIMAAEHMDSQAMHFLVKHTGGVICVAMEGRDCDRLALPLMVPSRENEESLYTAFTVSVDLREGTTTGISADDRSATVAALADPRSRAESFKRPGHVYPLRARDGGVLVRPGHTEAAVDLARLANCRPVGVISEVIDPVDSNMLRGAQLQAFAREHELKCITIADLVRFRAKHDRHVQRVASAQLPTRHGTFLAHTYRCLLNGQEHVALVRGNIEGKRQVLTCIHTESLWSDAFGAQHHGPLLDAALQRVSAAGEGLLVYLRRPRGGAGSLADELPSPTFDPAQAGAAPPAAQPHGPTDLRDYSVAAHIVQDLGVASLSLLTDSQASLDSLRGHGLTVDSSVKHSTASPDRSSAPDRPVRDSLALDSWYPSPTGAHAVGALHHLQ